MKALVFSLIKLLVPITALLPGSPLTTPLIRSVNRGPCANPATFGASDFRTCDDSLILQDQMLLTTFSVSPYQWSSGPTTFQTRAFEGSIPGPTIVIPVGQALPTRLRINVTSYLGPASYPTVLRLELPAKDFEGAPDTLVFLNRTGFDFAEDAVLQIGQGGAVELVRVVKVTSVASVTVERGVGGTAILTHRAGSPVRVVDVAAANFMREPNVTNLIVHGLQTSYIYNGLNRIDSVSPVRAVDVSVPEGHPTGTFLYRPQYKGSASLQVGGGMTGLLVISDEVSAVPSDLFYTPEVHVLLQEIRVAGAQEPVPAAPAGAAAAVGAGAGGIRDGRWRNISFIKSFVQDDIGQPYLGPVYNRSRLLSEYGRLVLTNGQFQPSLILSPSDSRRYRIANGGASSTFEISLRCAATAGPSCNNDGCELYLIALDGVFVNASSPVRVYTYNTGSSLILFPSSRADVLIKCSAVGEYALVSRADGGNDGLLGGPAVSGSDRPSQTLLSLSVRDGASRINCGVSGLASGCIQSSIPTTMPPLPDNLNEDLRTARVSRYFNVTLSQAPPRTLAQAPTKSATLLQLTQVPVMTVDGGGGKVKYRGDSTIGNTSIGVVDPPDHCMIAGQVEEWTIMADGMGLYTFHLQGHYFQIMSIVSVDGRAMRTGDLYTWRDTYGIGHAAAIVTIRVRARQQLGRVLFQSTILPDYEHGMAAKVDVLSTCPVVCALPTCWRPTGVITTSAAEGRRGSWRSSGLSQTALMAVAVAFAAAVLQ